MTNNGKAILVVDDSNLVRRFYRSSLEAAGFKVDEALNGLEAIEKLLVAHVDLLVVDVNMPQMDGFSFLKVLRRSDLALSSIPALITSTEKSPEDFAAASSAGANHYLVKPVEGDTLVLFARMICGITA